MRCIQLAYLWLLIAAHWVAKALPTVPAETPARLHTSWYSIFESLDHDRDGLLSFNDLVCSSRISNDLSKCRIDLHSSQSLAVESREDSLKQFYRMVKMIDKNGDGLLSFEELWMSVEKQRTDGKLTHLQDPEYEAFLEKSGRCAGSNPACESRFQMHLLSLNLGLSDRQVVSCVINNPCENVCACFEKFAHDQWYQDVMIQSVNARAGSHLSSIQARIFPFLAFFIDVLIGLIVAFIGSRAMDLYNTIPSNYYLDLAGSLGSASQNSCCAEYYWSDSCGNPGSSESRTCSKGGNLVNPQACDSLKAPASQTCSCGFLGAKCWFSPIKCKPLCLIENTGGCSCRLFEYDILKNQYYNGQVLYAMNTNKRGLCADWCSTTSGCVGFNLEATEKNKDQPLVCTFLSTATDGPHSSQAHVYFQKKQNTFNPDSDLDQLRNAVMQFSKAPTCPNDPSVRSMNANAQFLSSPSGPQVPHKVISSAIRFVLFDWLLYGRFSLLSTSMVSVLIFLIPNLEPLLGLITSLWSVQSQIRTDLPLAQPNPQFPPGMSRDPQSIIDSVVCSLNENMREASSKTQSGISYEMKQSQISMIQAGPGDSFALTFYKFICDTSITTENRCRLTDLDRVLIDGGRSIGNLRGFLDQAQNVRINDQDQGYKVNYIVATHLDLDHLGGITSLLNSDVTSGTHYISSTAHIMIDHPFDSSLRASIGNAPITASCGAAVAALESGATYADWSSQARPNVGIDTALIDFLWHTSHGMYEVVSSRGALGFTNTVTGLRMDVVGPSNEIIRKSLNSKNMCGAGVDGEPEASEARNMISIMTMFTFAGKTLLFTVNEGDATSSAMKSLWSSGLISRSRHYDFLKVPHHASARTSTETDFRNLIGDIYLVSGGQAAYRHPNKGALESIIRGRTAGLAISPWFQSNFDIYLTNWDTQPANNLDELIALSPNDYHYSMYTLNARQCSWLIDQSGAISKPITNLEVIQKI
ncbi:hypothetical protein K7432_012029 [Basidiobolus ranarum]|uniref:EF-hand domain-containing protein n=1 Tax=Basidiobolus ranarum TaxID=34480 RepID=A0ABR2WLG7_9FUNG